MGWEGAIDHKIYWGGTKADIGGGTIIVTLIEPIQMIHFQVHCTGLIFLFVDVNYPL